MLTDVKVRKAVAGDKDYKLADAHGLYLLVRPNGSRLWRMKYRAHGKEKLLSFGAYPDVSLTEARDLRDAARKAVREGLDPAMEKKRRVMVNRDQAAQTFEVVARQWHEMQRGRWAPVHADDVIRSLDRDVFPDLGALPIASIDAPLVLSTLRKVERRGSIETAKRVRQRMSAVFVFGISEGICTGDPAAIITKALKPKPKKRRQPAITDIAELQRLLTATEASGASPVTLLASRLLALTAVRPGMVRGVQWTEFLNVPWGTDDEAPEAMWHVPAERMKLIAERKDEDAFDMLVPLSPPAVDVLRAVRRLTGNTKLVFPGQRHAHRPLSENAIGYLYNRAGWHGRHVPHGWRAAFSTIMNERAKLAGIAGDREVIDLMLGHIPEGTSGSEGAYNRALYMPRRIELAREWGALLMDGLVPAADLLTVERRPSPRRDERMTDRAAYLDDIRAKALALLPDRPRDAAAGFMAEIRKWPGGAVLNRTQQRRLKDDLLSAGRDGDAGLVRLLIEAVA